MREREEGRGTERGGGRQGEGIRIGGMEGTRGR